MKSVVRWAVHNSPAMNTLMASVLAVGLASMFMLRREVFPEFELEIILVSVPYPGASPAEVEEGICLKIEEATRSLKHVKKQTTVAQEGAGFVILELDANVPDIQKVLNEVRSEIDRIPSFPELAEDPEIQQITFREQAIRIGVVGPSTEGMSEEEAFRASLALRELAEEIRDDILQLDVVSQADIIGAREYQIDIEISEDTLREYGLTLQEAARIVRRENIEIPGGIMRTASQEVLLRGKGKSLLGKDIAKIPLVTQSDGVVLTVEDLGNVRDAFADTTAVNLINSQPGLVISINRTSTEDLLAITEAVHHYVGQQSAKLPSGYELVTFGDRSIDVRDRMELLSRNGLQGLLLVFLVLALFLELKLAFWVALGIPIAVLGACAALLFGGQTLNMLSMFAFLMALGIVVDDAIVIGENIYTHRNMGKSFVQAAIDGTYEVMPSVTASVFTTIIAFAPLFFVSGVMGKFIAVMPLAVIAMLVISLVESLIILPCHLGHVRLAEDGNSRTIVEKTHRFVRGMRWPVRQTFGAILLGLAYIIGFFAYPFGRLAALFHLGTTFTGRVLEFTVQRIYLPTLRWSLNNPASVLAVIVSIILITGGLMRSGRPEFNIFPKLDSNEILAKVVYPDGTPGRVTEESVKRIEAAIREADQEYFREQGSHLVKMTHLAVGEITGPGATGPDSRTSGSHVGAVNVELVETSQRTVTSQDVLSDWRKRAGLFAGAETLTFGTPDFGPGGTPIEFKLLADARHMHELELAVEDVKAKLAQYDGVIDIGDDSRPGKWEFQIKIKEDARAMGVPLADLAETIRAAYYGEEVMRLQRGRHEVKLMVRYPPEERRSLADFEDIRVRTGEAWERPLTELAEVDVARGYAEINRVDQLRSITISADVEEGVANSQSIVADLRADYVPVLLERYPGVSVRWEGQQEQTAESVSSLGTGLAIALLCMFALLTVEFRSYFQPLLILLIIPFGVVGAIWGHLFMGLPVTLFSLFGLVALTGVIVNDSIVLIDFINHRVAEGMEIKDALLEAGRRRFRPVLLTSITTVAGLLPLLTERSFQAQVLIPMAASLVFGLILATVLILLLVPTFYLLYSRLTFAGADKNAWQSSATLESAAPQANAVPKESEDGGVSEHSVVMEYGGAGIGLQNGNGQNGRTASHSTKSISGPDN